jgi:hypothetical protein
MNAVEIEEAISALAEQPFDSVEFPSWRDHRDGTAGKYAMWERGEKFWPPPDEIRHRPLLRRSRKGCAPLPPAFEGSGSFRSSLAVNIFPPRRLR